jgi:HK97 family phage major capsid protein
MSGRIVQKVFETSPMRAFASVQVISTDALKGVYDNDEVDVFWEGETQTPQEGGTPQVGEWRIPVHEMRTLVKASQQLLEDAAVNVESWLADKTSSKMIRAENLAFVSGSGVGRPRGFLTYTDSTDLTIGIEQSPTGASGAFAAVPNGGDVLINALYSLKAAYAANATWFMNRTVFAAVRKLKDSDGAYLWQPGIAAGQPVTILGKPYASFEDMPNLGASSLSIAVGDMAQAYQIVDRLGISTLRDPYSYKPFVGFYSRKRVGGAIVNGEALKIIRFNT